jgi:hypothetical protein
MMVMDSSTRPRNADFTPKTLRHPDFAPNDALEPVDLRRIVRSNPWTCAERCTRARGPASNDARQPAPSRPTMCASCRRFARGAPRCTPTPQSIRDDFSYNLTRQAALRIPPVLFSGSRHPAYVSQPKGSRNEATKGMGCGIRSGGDVRRRGVR